MRLDSDRLRRDFKFTDLPRMYCPDCSDGLVRLKETDVARTFDARTRAADESLSPEDFEASGNFRCEYYCSNCESRGNMIGEVFQSHTPISYSFSSYELETNHRYLPKAMYPAPLLFVPEGEIPEPIRESVNGVFFHYWTDPTACVGRCRIAIELVLDHLGIPSETPNGDPIFLHARIEKYRTLNEEIGRLMMAAKWLGNEAAHALTLTRSDSVDAMELMAAVLDAVFNKRMDAVRALADQIIASKLPLSRSPSQS